MRRIVNDEALDILFRTVREGHEWLARPVSDTMLRAVWELMKVTPASRADAGIRVLFVRSEEAKARLVPAIAAGDRIGMAAAPIVAVVGHGLDGEGAAGPAGGTARREAVLHAAYLVLAARALGLDCKPVWDFDASLVDGVLFPDGRLASTFLCGIGYGDVTQPSGTAPSRGFAEVCAIL